MTEEELQELENSVIEARNHLIELNDAYNEILTKEHEEKAKKIDSSRRNRGISSLFESLNGEEKPKSEKEKEIEKENSKYFLRLILLIFFGLANHLFILPATILILVNVIYSLKKNNKIEKEYDSTKKDDKKKNDDVPKENSKDALYEEVFKARRFYHTLRKEYESKKFNSELNKKEEDNNAVGTQYNGMNPQLYQIYFDYIDYINNILSMDESEVSNNKSKVYEISPKEL